MLTRSPAAQLGGGNGGLEVGQDIERSERTELVPSKESTSLCA